MSFRQTVSKYLTNHAETRERHEDLALVSHYYKTTKDKALAELEELFSNKQLYDMNSISKEHGEISVYTRKGKKLFIIATVIMVRPYQTAIDFSITSESPLPFDFGYSNKMINQLYAEMDQHLPQLDRN